MRSTCQFCNHQLHSRLPSWTAQAYLQQLMTFQLCLKNTAQETVRSGFSLDHSSLCAPMFQRSDVFVVLTIAVTTNFENAYPVWVTNRGAGQPFIIQANVRFPTEIIQYPWCHCYQPQALIVFLVGMFGFSRLYCLLVARPPPFTGLWQMVWCQVACG